MKPSEIGFKADSSKRITNPRLFVWAVAGFMTAVSFGIVPIGSGHTAGLIAPQTAEAQNFGQRIIQGKVLSDTESPVGGATVFLKNLKNRNVKSFTSNPAGAFRFAQVGMIDDYEVWAEHGGKKSAVKTVSSFDSRKQVDFELKLK